MKTHYYPIGLQIDEKIINFGVILEMPSVKWYDIASILADISIKRLNKLLPSLLIFDQNKIVVCGNDIREEYRIFDYDVVDKILKGDIYGLGKEKLLDKMRLYDISIHENLLSWTYDFCQIIGNDVDNGVCNFGIIYEYPFRGFYNAARVMTECYLTDFDLSINSEDSPITYGIGIEKKFLMEKHRIDVGTVIKILSREWMSPMVKVLKFLVEKNECKSNTKNKLIIPQLKECEMLTEYEKLLCLVILKLKTIIFLDIIMKLEKYWNNMQFIMIQFGL